MSDSNALTELEFQVFGFVSRSPHEVFEAVAHPEQLSKYFTTGGAAGRLEVGPSGETTTVTWDFADFPGAFPVEVVASEQDERIVIRWGGDAAAIIGGGDSTEVVFDFVSIDGGSRTKVTITERAWRVTAAGAQGAFGNCMGWTGMLAALKMWLEHGVNLREGFYK